MENISEIQQLAEQYLQEKAQAEETQRIAADLENRFHILVETNEKIFQARLDWKHHQAMADEMKARVSKMKSTLADMLSYEGEDKLSDLPKGVAQAVYTIVQYDEAEATSWALGAGDLGASVLQLNKKAFEKLVEGMPESAAAAVGIPARVLKWVKARIS